MGPKENLRNKVDGNELDLSLSNLTVVPVRELASLPKATHLDLSCNQLTILPDAFCSLTHLVKLDLSKNMLQSLPPGFGQLIRLQQLDLYKNQLTTLPLSFAKLRSLQWLDLKDNPLEQKLQKAAGLCIDPRQCKACAKGVVALMAQATQDFHLQQAEELKEQKAKEEAQKLIEELEREEIRKQKKLEKELEKERKKKEYLASKELTKKSELKTAKKGTAKKQTKKDASSANGLHPQKKTVLKTSRHKCYSGLFITIFVTLVAVFLGIYLYCNNNPRHLSCQHMWVSFISTKTMIVASVKEYLNILGLF